MRNNDPGSNAIVVRTPEQILPYCVIRTEHTGGNKCAGRPMAAKNRTTQGTSRVVRYNSSAAALAAAATLPRGRGGRVLPVVAALAALQPQPPPAHQNPPHQLGPHQSVSSGGYPVARVNGNGANGTVTPVVPQQGPSQQGPTQMPVSQAGVQSLSAPWNPQVQQSASYPQVPYTPYQPQQQPQQMYYYGANGTSTPAGPLLPQQGSSQQGPSQVFHHTIC